ncbi:MAG: nucleotidyl transferase AbiEii/AbiGii toxin family protein [Candidatus Omnitrophica bacterium]|nr:nucleotidyl transferase AbiEii/AbiGii toxin family protein [Candidatus Omnitrophota bacterium]
MSIKIIQERLNSYHSTSEQEEENALREIAQEVVLGGLSRAGFFKVAGFHGGTSLRILYSLQRFSEDLDFTLVQQKDDFRLDRYLRGLQDELTAFGFEFHIIDKNKMDQTVCKQFLKDDSLARLLTFDHLKPGRDTRSIRIKIEVDTNPPPGSDFEVKFHDFPFPYEIAVQDLPSLFAGKNHALLCRPFVKGRDWYDFVWYVSRDVPINFKYLSAAINQLGPWQGQAIPVDKNWYLQQMKERIESLDFDQARDDVKRFIKPADLPSLDLWSTEFFLDRLSKLNREQRPHSNSSEEN